MAFYFVLFELRKNYCNSFELREISHYSRTFRKTERKYRTYSALINLFSGKKMLPHNHRTNNAANEWLKRPILQW